MKKSQLLRRLAVFCLSLALLAAGIRGGAYLKDHPPGIFTSSKNQEEYQKSFDEYLNSLFRQEVTATTINLHYTLKSPENYGITEYEVTYGDIDEESRQASVAALENTKSALKGFKTKSLTLDQRLTYDILKEETETQLSAGKFYFYEELLRPSTGIQAELPVLMAEYAFYDEGDVLDYLNLLNQTKDYFRQILLFEMDKANKGLFMPQFAAEDIISQCRNFIADKDKNYLLDTFDNKIQNMTDLTDQQKQGYREQNQRAVTEVVIPAYEMMIQGLEKLKESGENQQGLSYLPQGKEYYEYLVAANTGSERTIDELKEATAHQRAEDMSEAARLIAKQPELLSQATSYAFAQQDPTAILMELQEKMKEDFPTPPDTAFTIKYVHPSLEEYMAPAFYLAIPIDDISQNSIHINGSNHYQKLKLYTTLAHEGFPGHLYQNVMERSQGFSPVRSLLGASGYSEGWATYVEMISYSYADIDAGLSALLMRDQSALLSLYATADMGIHYDGWSLEEMMKFFAEYQITDKEVLTEVYQMIVEEPAHYLKYYIGYLEFLNLKEQAKNMYGEDYSDYRFHEALMKMGPAPFSLLEKYLPEYYDKKDGD